jgi:pimeloyl-ACP methyl ester carboxylesterase
MARDLAELLVRRGAMPSLVVAHSMGGNVAVELAVSHPELVMAMVLLDPAYADPFWAEAQERTSDIEARGSIAVAENAHLAVAPDADPALIALIRESALQTDPRVLAEGLSSTYLDPDSFGHIDDTLRRVTLLTVPLLALYPDLDRAARAESLPVEQTVRYIADAGHFLGEEQPAAVWAAITDWLAGQGTCT